MEERRRHTTVRQLELLVQYLEEHRDLALGRVRSKEARAVAARLWRECTLILNAEGPARTCKELPKVWNDLKCRVRAKVVSINASQQATGGGPSTAASLTPLEDRVASILGRDIGPLPNVRQDQFAIQEDDGIGVAEEVVQEDVVADSESVVVHDGHQSQNIEVARPAIASPTPSVMGQVPSPTSSTQNGSTIRVRQRRPREGRAAARQPTARIPPAQSNRSALEESRSTILRIETLRAEAALLNAQATKSMADGFKMLAESVDRFARVYAQQHGGTSGAQNN